MKHTSLILLMLVLVYVKFFYPVSDYPFNFHDNQFLNNFILFFKLSVSTFFVNFFFKKIFNFLIKNSFLKHISQEDGDRNASHSRR